MDPLTDTQIRGAFVQGIAAALYEEFVSDETGAFHSGTFADYLVPTAAEIPPVELLHIESPSPFTPLGAKGLAEGNCMSVPACVANAVADALGVKDVTLPVSPRRIHELLAEAEPPPPARQQAPVEPEEKAGGRKLRGHGTFEVAAAPAVVWRSLLDPESLKSVIPGCHELERRGENDYRALVSLGVGPVRGKFEATVKLTDLVTEKSGRIGGTLTGPLGGAEEIAAAMDMEEGRPIAAPVLVGDDDEPDVGRPVHPRRERLAHHQRGIALGRGVAIEHAVEPGAALGERREGEGRRREDVERSRDLGIDEMPG